MDKQRIADRVASELVAKFPPKAADYNKVPDVDEFWEWSIDEAKKYSGSSLSRASDIGDVIMFLNMAVQGWKRLKG